MYRGFSQFFKFSSPKFFKTRSSILLIAPLVISFPQVHNFFWNSKKSNDIKDRISISVEVSNKPCEDRSDKIQLTAVKGYAFGVFDGHGGWQMSHLCSKQLLKTLDEKIAHNKHTIFDQQELIKKSLRDTFQAIEEKFLKQARQGYKLGFGKFARAGSCALVCVVCNNKIYSANAGDSLGLIIEKDEKNRMNFIDLNMEFNADKPEEQERLKKLFPKESDIFICKRENNTSCYVKGRLQCTRSLGDLRLKHEEFNNPEKFTPQHEFQSQLKTFTGPYVNWQPQIRVFPIKKTYKSIVLASDGLWDQVERQEAAELFKSNPIKQLPNILIQKALQKAALAANLTVDKMRQIPAGKKRKIHDDITVVVADLESQLKE